MALGLNAGNKTIMPSYSFVATANSTVHWGGEPVFVDIGPEDYNMGLGQRRAEAVRGYLVSKGLRSSRLTARSFGETRPVASNDTDEGRQTNRRVELHPRQ